VPAAIRHAGAIALLLSLVAAAQDRQGVEGVWINGDGDGWIELKIVDDRLRGRIIGSPDDPDNRNPSRLDVENPDPALRSRELRGLMILSDFSYDGEGRWTGGWVYDPNSGNTYKGTITFVDDATLKLRGFVGISLFGCTETWRRRESINQ
jgi:uncharacterized protein (DUF2147 family)